MRKFPEARRLYTIAQNPTRDFPDDLTCRKWQICVAPSFFPKFWCRFAISISICIKYFNVLWPTVLGEYLHQYIFDNLLWLVMRWRVSGAKVEQVSDVGFLAKMMIQQHKRYKSYKKYKRSQPIIHQAWKYSSDRHLRTHNKYSPDNCTISDPRIAQDTLAKKV